MGTASGAFHQFAEATSKRWFTDAWQDKLAAGFTNSGSKSGDKGHTLQFFQTLAAQHGMHWVNLGLKPGWNSTAGSEYDLNRLGFFAGAGAQTNSDAGPRRRPQGRHSDRRTPGPPHHRDRSRLHRGQGGRQRLITLPARRRDPIPHFGIQCAHRKGPPPFATERALSCAYE